MRLWIGLLGIVLASAAYAQDFQGTWQGTIKGEDAYPFIARIAKPAGKIWTVKIFSIIEDWGNNLEAENISVQGGRLAFSVPGLGASYEGTLDAGRNAIAGTWHQGNAYALNFTRATPGTKWGDPSPHEIRFVTVAKGLKLEVLDWGGTGRPLVLLAGLGNTAHVFDTFAPKLTAHYHVYGITRRGFGDSGIPVPTAENYSATRLGDDVFAAIDALGLKRPILAGHSIAGEELSAICSRRPERVSGLIYLEAAYGYAFDASAQGADPNDPTFPMTETADVPRTPRQKAMAAVLSGRQSYRTIACPALALFSWPVDPSPALTIQASTLEAAIPSAHVVRIPNSAHYIFVSNEAEVLNEINAFIEELPN